MTFSDHGFQLVSDLGGIVVRTGDEKGLAILAEFDIRGKHIFRRIQQVA